MSRRKKSGFGLVKHSKSKMSSRYYEREHRGLNQPRRDINVRVGIERGSVPTNTGRKHGFWAMACMGGKKTRHSYKKCGPSEFGRTPTVAVKRALVALGRSSEVK